MVKSIYLQDGEEIFVDDEDYERVNQYNWSISSVKKTRVIQTRVRNVTKRLPNFILNEECSYQKNKNNDFTRKNLAYAGKYQRYSRPRRTGSSKYKGVSWSKVSKKWMVKITFQGELRYLGIYSDEECAGEKYNDAVDYYWGGKGYKNIIGVDNRHDNYKRNNKIYQPRKKRNSKSKYRGVLVGRYGYNVRIKKQYITHCQNEYYAALIYNKCALYLYENDAILNDVPIKDELKEFISNWEIPEKIKRLKGEHVGGNI